MAFILIKIYLFTFPDRVSSFVGITVGLSLAAIVFLLGMVHVIRKRTFQQQDALIEKYLPETNSQILDSKV